jgi:long-chain fatty acid transport protein
LFQSNQVIYKLKINLMKKVFLLIVPSLLSFHLFAQTGHIMQGIGARNMSMGGAATGQPIDISGALQWNPAAISAFKSKIFQ